MIIKYIKNIFEKNKNQKNRSKMLNKMIFTLPILLKKQFGNSNRYRFEEIKFCFNQGDISYSVLYIALAIYLNKDDYFFHVEKNHPQLKYDQIRNEISHLFLRGKNNFKGSDIYNYTRSIKFTKEKNKIMATKLRMKNKELIASQEFGDEMVGGMYLF